MPNTAEPLTLEALQHAVAGSAAAFRCRRRLQPAGGPGDKVFPPTFAGAVYAVEQRRLPDRAEAVTCVLLDTVQSQANRMELALQEAVDNDKLKMPLVVVDFSKWSPTGNVEADKAANRLIEAVGKITSLQVPHRLADAILRYSQTPDGVEFRESEKGKALNTASLQNATPLYQLCPTALIFGMWDSTGPKGGLGAKFERALVSEVVAVGASFGVKTASRIDPLIPKTEGIVLYKTLGGSWTLKPDEAEKDKSGKPILYGKKGKVSEANLGNVTPDFDRYDQKSIKAENRMTPDPMRSDGGFIEANRIRPGGVTIEYAEQVTTLSLIVLRRLRFPMTKNEREDAEGFDKRAQEAEIAARTVLAALGLCAATLAFENGMGLRSRCLLWPEGPMQWELLDKPGDPPMAFTLTGGQAIELFKAAVQAARNAGLSWEEEPITLLPQQKLVDLVRLSQIEATKESSDGGDWNVCPRHPLPQRLRGCFPRLARAGRMAAASGPRVHGPGSRALPDRSGRPGTRGLALAGKTTPTGDPRARGLAVCGGDTICAGKRQGRPLQDADAFLGANTSPSAPHLRPSCTGRRHGVAGLATRDPPYPRSATRWPACAAKSPASATRSRWSKCGWRTPFLAGCSAGLKMKRAAPISSACHGKGLLRRFSIPVSTATTWHATPRCCWRSRMPQIQGKRPRRRKR